MFGRWRSRDTVINWDDGERTRDCPIMTTLYRIDMLGKEEEEKREGELTLKKKNIRL